MTKVVRALRTALSGPLALWRALVFIRQHPRTLLYCVAPVGISILVYGGLLLVGGWWLASVVGEAIAWSAAWYVVALRVIVQAIVVVALLAVLTITFSLLANVIASPFNDLLSQFVERTVVGSLEETAFSWKQFGVDSVRAIREELLKLVIFGIPQLLLLALNLIPGIGSILYIVVLVPVTSFTMAYDYLDLPLSRRYTGLLSKIQFVQKRAISLLPFGATCAAVLAIPLLNILIMPVCVIAGTLVYLEHATAGTDRD